MRQTNGAFCSQISKTVFLTLAVSLTTGCFWSNASIRGGDSTFSSQNHKAVPVTLTEKDQHAREEDKENEDEELSFAFKKPVKADIGDGCSGNTDCSHESIVYKSKLCKQIGTCTADLFVVEFDDQGRLYYPQQMENLFEFLRNTMSPKRMDCKPSEGPACFDDVSLVVAAHGWRHNADFEDWNLRQLREVLYNAVLFEADKPLPFPKTPHYNPSDNPRKVVGVYLGWRGALVKEYPNSPRIPFTTNWTLSDLALGLPAVLSFWDRKGAAMDVALGSTRELFARLGYVRAAVNDLRNNAKRMGRDREWYDKCVERAGSKSRCVAMRTLILGHSFGSLAIYNAISESLIDSVSAGIDSPKNSPTAGDQCTMEETSLGKEVSSPYADLIVLINPAFEGARFEPLYQTSLNRMKRSPYSPTQDPVLVIVTGTSDYATKYAFKWGRWFSTLFQDNSPESRDGAELAGRADEERNANRKTVGHIPRYMTHYLDIFPDTKKELPKEIDADQKACLTTDWYDLTLKGVSGDKPPESTVDEITSLWKNKREESTANKHDWPARAFCGRVRLSFAMQEVKEGEDPLEDLPGKSTDRNPWGNQLLSKTIPKNKWGSGPRDLYNPIWVVRTHDERIIDGHNGYHDSYMVGFILQLYRDVLSPK